MLFVYLGAVVSMELVWGLADLFNSFMAVPNIIGLWMLRKTIEAPRNC
jgi:AGCS family alanine or glycine:cation symporter